MEDDSTYHILDRRGQTGSDFGSRDVQMNVKQIKYLYTSRFEDIGKMIWSDQRGQEEIWHISDGETRNRVSKLSQFQVYMYPTVKKGW